ncbi:MAG: nicotinamide-nucleotide amidohydrolase family protein, partial [Ilumatobacteraceae bacterium]
LALEEQRAVLPDLASRTGTPTTIVSRVLRTWGESESGLNERLQGIIDELDHAGNPTLAFLASGWEGLKVRLTAKAATTDAAEAIIAPVEARIRDILGSQVFGVDGQTMERVVVDLLQQRGWTLALAESVTGGLVTSRLVDVDGVSATLRGAVVSYASDVKFDLLDVDEGPVVNERAAQQMAEGVRRLLGSDVAVSLTGVAGPAEQDGMPAGMLCVGVALPDRTITRSFRLPGLRDQMRQMSVITALDLLRRELLGVA